MDSDTASFDTDFDCQIKIKESKVVQMEMKGDCFKVQNPFNIARLDAILRAFATIEGLGLIPCEDGDDVIDESPKTSTIVDNSKLCGQSNLDNPPCKFCGGITVKQGHRIFADGEKIQKFKCKACKKISSEKRRQFSAKMGRHHKYSEEIKQRVIKLKQAGEKMKRIQAIVLDEFNIELNRNVVYKWLEESKDSHKKVILKSYESTMAGGTEPATGEEPFRPEPFDIEIINGMVECPDQGREREADLCSSTRCDNLIRMATDPSTGKSFIGCGVRS